MPTPRTTTNQISKGTAPRRAAQQRAKTDESKAKLDALKERQEGAAPEAADGPKVGEPDLSHAEPARARRAHLAAVPDAPARAPRDTRPRVNYSVDGKAVGTSQNTLAHVTRVTGTKDAPRWTTTALRAWLKDQGVVDPAHEAFQVTLPNGRVLAGSLPSS